MKHELSHLVQIDSKSKQNFLKHYLYDRKKTGTLANYQEKFWIGLEDGQGNTWVNGEVVAYMNWCEGQPDDSHYPAFLHNSQGFCWSDRNSKHEYGYVCEMPASVP